MLTCRHYRPAVRRGVQRAIRGNSYRRGGRHDRPSAAGRTRARRRACRACSPRCRCALVGDRDNGWRLFEEIADGAVRSVASRCWYHRAVGGGVGGDPRPGSRTPADFDRLGALWRGISTDCRAVRWPAVSGCWGAVSISGAARARWPSGCGGNRPISRLTMRGSRISFTRPDDFRQRWRKVLATLQHPETAPAPIVEVLAAGPAVRRVLMMCAERALIYQGEHDPGAALDTADALFDHGPRCSPFIGAVLYPPCCRPGRMWTTRLRPGSRT